VSRETHDEAISVFASAGPGTPALLEHYLHHLVGLCIIVVVILFLGLAGCRRGRETGFD